MQTRITSVLQRLQVEDTMAAVFKHVRPVLPAFARFLLVATFLEDSLRMILLWQNQHSYFSQRGFGAWGATLFLLFNITAQVLGSALVMARKRVEFGVGILVFDLLAQALAYNLFTSLSFVLRALSVCGGLLLVLADALVSQKSRSVFAGLPQLDQETRTTYLQLAGRVLLVCLCLSIMVGGGNMELTPMRIVLVAVGTIMCLMVILGFKAKMTSIVLLVGLSLTNVILNSFWQFDVSPSSSRDVVQFDFFQTLSVLGGFILLALLGPGDLSVDERKKAL